MLSDSISDRTLVLSFIDIFVVSCGYNQLTLHFDSYCCFLTSVLAQLYSSLPVCLGIFYDSL